MLLIDELDRADDEFEAFLLEVLSDFTVTVPELGTIAAERAAGRRHHLEPHAELHDALKRRCLYHWIDFPDLEREVEIIRLRAPGVSEALARSVAATVARLREPRPRQAARRRRGDRLGAGALACSAPSRRTGTPARETLGWAVKNREDTRARRGRALRVQ